MVNDWNFSVGLESTCQSTSDGKTFVNPCYYRALQKFSNFGAVWNEKDETAIYCRCRIFCYELKEGRPVFKKVSEHAPFHNEPY